MMREISAMRPAMPSSRLRSSTLHGARLLKLKKKFSQYSSGHPNRPSINSSGHAKHSYSTTMSSSPKTSDRASHQPLGLGYGVLAQASAKIAQDHYEAQLRARGVPEKKRTFRFTRARAEGSESASSAQPKPGGASVYQTCADADEYSLMLRIGAQAAKWTQSEAFQSRLAQKQDSSIEQAALSARVRSACTHFFLP